MMCARLLGRASAGGGSRFFRASQALFDRVVAAYGRSLTVVLRHQGATLLVAVATVVATCALYVAVPKGFFSGPGHRAGHRHDRGRPSPSRLPPWSSASGP